MFLKKKCLKPSFKCFYCIIFKSLHSGDRRAFSKGSVFSDCSRYFSVSDNRIRSKTAPFPFENGVVWMGPNLQVNITIMINSG